MNRAQIEARIAELEAENAAATSWGAAVGALHEEIEGLKRQLPCSAESCEALIKRLQARVDAHDKMCFGSSMALGYYSGNDARLMRDAIDALRLVPDAAQPSPAAPVETNLAVNGPGVAEQLGLVAVEQLANKIERQDIEFKTDGDWLSDDDSELICAALRAYGQPPYSSAATVDRSEWAINGAHEFAETMRAAPVDHLLQRAVFASGEIVQDHLPDCSAGSDGAMDLAIKLDAYAERYSKEWAMASPTISWDDLHLITAALSRTEPQTAPTREEIAKVIAPHAHAVVRLHGRGNASRFAVQELDLALEQADAILALSRP